MGRLAVWRCVGAAVLFGASAPAASVLAPELSPFTLAGLLYLGAGIAVFPVALRERPSRAAVRAGAGPLAIAVVAGGALGPVLLMAGLARTNAASASLLLNVELVATILLAATVFREHLGARVLWSAAIVSVSAVVLLWEPGAAVDVGGLLIVGACLCWGLDNSVTALIDQVRPEQVTLAKGAVAGTSNFLIGAALVGLGGISLAQVVAALVIGALGYGVSITWWVRGARDLGAARAQVIFAAAPFRPTPTSTNTWRWTTSTSTPTTTATTTTSTPTGSVVATATGTSTSRSSTSTSTCPISTTDIPTDHRRSAGGSGQVRGDRGSPRTRSPMMSRRIWVVPPMIV